MTCRPAARTVRVLVPAPVACLAALSLLLVGGPPAAASTGASSLPAAMQPWLVGQLAAAEPGEALPVLVHGTNLAAARDAVQAAGMQRLHDLERIDVTIAAGTPGAIRDVSRRPGVTYVEGDRPIEFFQDTSHRATRGAEAIAALTDGQGRPLNGAGVSVAVIDTGVDPTHPFFREPDGSSAVVANLKNVCVLVTTDPGNCFVDAGPLADTDAASAGGHGTHVSGIVAGRPVTLTDGARLHGAAPGTKIVSLSMGAGVAIINANLAFEWVLEHHAAPCGPDVAPDVCPPIRVTNNSYGPLGGGEFDPEAAIVQLQRELAAEGVATVWANGNAGGDGSDNRSNPPAQDPTPGILSVASYFDENTGTRDGTVSGFSSRGDRERPSTWPDISAPGQSTTSSCRPYHAICATSGAFRNGPGLADLATFADLSGTSMAAPHIAGITAQLIQADPAATLAEIEGALKETAHKYGDPSSYTDVRSHTSSFDKGAGLVDVVAAVQALRGNRVANASFEHSADGSPAGWTGGPGTGYDRSGRHASDGDAAVSITGQGADVTGTWTSAPFPVSAGGTYGVAVTVATEQASSAPNMLVEFLDNAGTVVGSATGVTAEFTGDHAATELLGTVTAPQDAARARLVLRGFAPGDPAPSGTAWFDRAWLG